MAASSLDACRRPDREHGKGERAGGKTRQRKSENQTELCKSQTEIVQSHKELGRAHKTRIREFEEEILILERQIKQAQSLLEIEQKTSELRKERAAAASSANADHSDLVEACQQIIDGMSDETKVNVSVLRNAYVCGQSKIHVIFDDRAHLPDSAAAAAAARPGTA